LGPEPTTIASYSIGILKMEDYALELA